VDRKKRGDASFSRHERGGGEKKGKASWMREKKRTRTNPLLQTTVVLIPKEGNWQDLFSTSEKKRNGPEDSFARGGGFRAIAKKKHRKIYNITEER